MAKKIIDNAIPTRLSNKQLTYLIQKATELYSTFNPFGANSVLNDLADNPKVPTKDKMAEALATYNKKESSENLQAYLDFMEVYDPLVNKIIDYLCGLLSHDISYVCKNDYMLPEEYKSDKYKEDVKRRNMILDAFNSKEEFANITRNVLKRGIYYVYLRGNSDALSESPLQLNKKDISYTIQEMPQNKCIKGKTINGVPTYDIDMNYFNNVNVDINGYPPIFKTYLDRIYDTTNQKYNPSAPLNKRKGVYSTWVQTSPFDGAWYFKWDTSNNNIVPPLSNIIMQCLDNDTVSKLQMDKDMISAFALIVGDMPLNNKQKGAVTPNAFAIEPEVAIDLMTLVKKGLKRNIQAVMMPTEGSKLYQYQDYNENMANNSNKITAGKSVSASGVVYSTEKSNMAELQAQITNDYIMMSKLYNQYETFLNFYINRKMEKYHWRFKLWGSTQTFIRDIHKKNILETASLGLVPNISILSTIIGIEPQDYERALREARYGGLTDLLTSLQSVHTANAQSQGAPTKDDDDLKDGGAVAREY